ncbi:HD family phosphohydrolase [Paenibacillus contaminans]|uniref:Metal-dependent phosphohydrolase n=1 Tax=Paenibacillus contaminans TaxID=450362 RepID=A0A329MR20_9BACL|nr:metal-dependent phosphohydrolase [Paenibacillus contaminans]
MIRNDKPIKGKVQLRFSNWKYSAGMRIVLFLALALFFYASLAGKVLPQTYDIKPNTVSEKTIVANQQIQDFVATQKAQDEAALKVAPVYRYAAIKHDQLIEALYDKLELNNADAEMKYDIKVSLYRDLFPSVLGDYTNQALNNARSGGQYSDTFLTEMKSQLESQQYKIPEEALYKLPRLTKEELTAMEPVTKDIVGKLMTDATTDAATARTRVTELVNSSTLTKNTSRELVQEIARFAIMPNKFLDAKGTDEARAQARENTKPVFINKNDVLVHKGEMITDQLYKQLGDLNLLKDKANYGPQLGLVLFCAFLTFGLFMFVRQSELPISTNNAQLLMLVIIFLLTLVTMRIVAIGESLEYSHIGYLAPVSLGSMLIMVLLNSQLAFASSVLISILASIVFNNDADQLFDFRYGLVTLIVCYTAVFALQKASQRSAILKAGVIVSLISALAVTSLILLDNHYTVREVAFSISFAIAGGLLSAVLVIGLLPFFETAFGILSPLKLVELSNPNLPLLRKLLTETPGTYHHSVMVGNLSEAAAEAIGANGLLCRVGSYYHDIGKTKRPHYFIENQMGMENPHDLIDPSLSKSIIVAHARDGVEMLKEYNIPKPIRDIAEQHHGTTLLKFFYHKAKQQNEHPETPVAEADFRYPGPKAQSKEAAIVGIADCVEAAVRSLRNPTIEQIDSMVRKIIKDRLDDAQFNECDLTLKELDTVGKALKETLLGIFHSRIEYPTEPLSAAKPETQS